jgi:hypothetical protein
VVENIFPGFPGSARDITQALSTANNKPHIVKVDDDSGEFYYWFYPAPALDNLKLKFSCQGNRVYTGSIDGCRAAAQQIPGARVVNDDAGCYLYIDAIPAEFESIPEFVFNQLEQERDEEAEVARLVEQHKRGISFRQLIKDLKAQAAQRQAVGIWPYNLESMSPPARAALLNFQIKIETA